MLPSSRRALASRGSAVGGSGAFTSQVQRFALAVTVTPSERAWSCAIEQQLGARSGDEVAGSAQQHGPRPIIHPAIVHLGEAAPIGWSAKSVARTVARARRRIVGFFVMGFRVRLRETPAVREPPEVFIDYRPNGRPAQTGGGTEDYRSNSICPPGSRYTMSIVPPSTVGTWLDPGGKTTQPGS